MSLYVAATRSRAFSILLGCPLFHYRNRALHTKIKWWGKHVFAPLTNVMCMCVRACGERRKGGMEGGRQWRRGEEIERRMRVDKEKEQETEEREVVFLLCVHVSSQDIGFDIKWHTANSAHFASPSFFAADSQRAFCKTQQWSRWEPERERGAVICRVVIEAQKPNSPELSKAQTC